MNVVIDSNVILDGLCEGYLKKLLPDGKSACILDEASGKLSGEINEDELTVFITALPIDVMKYHGDFFRRYKKAPGWFFIIKGTNSHAVSLLKNAEINYDLNKCSYFFAPDPESFRAAVEKIAEEGRRIPGKTLIFFKHNRDEGVTAQLLAKYLFDNAADKYEIAYDAVDDNTDASFLLLCGEDERDFKQVTVPEALKPIFVVVHPEKRLQQYLHPEELISLLAAAFDMTPERAEARLFFVSTEADEWYRKRNTGINAVRNGLLMWDRFGLPVPASEYTAENIEAFLDKGYFDGGALKQRLADNAW